MTSAATTLTDLGFSPLESSLYTLLLKDGPSTGYRLAQSLGKAVANTYNAIESLQAKGAVLLVDDGGTRVCRAVDPAELFGRMQAALAARCAAAHQSLSRLNHPGDDERVYALRSRDQVVERARAMLRKARATAIIDLFPGLAGDLGPDLQRAAARGVAVGALTYVPLTLKGVQAVLHARPALVFDSWPGDSVVLVTDAEEHLMALFGPEGQTIQALWTKSPFVSCIHHDGLVSQLMAQLLDGLLFGTVTLEQARARRERFRALSILKTPGLKRFKAMRREPSVGTVPNRNGTAPTRRSTTRRKDR